MYTINFLPHSLYDVWGWIQKKLDARKRAEERYRRQQEELRRRELDAAFLGAIQGAVESFKIVEGFPNMATMVVGRPHQFAGGPFPFDPRDVCGFAWKQVKPGVPIRRFEARVAYTAYHIVCGFHVTIIFDPDPPSSTS